MDKVFQILGMANTEPLKEPRGLLRAIEVILAIFAFATTTSHSSSSSFSVKCADDTTKTTEIYFGYPFKLNENEFQTPFCPNTSVTPGVASPFGDFQSSSEFYVFVGVIAFLYATAALILYIFFDDKYREDDRIPTFDFVFSLVWTFLWLVSASAWAQGVTDLKYYSSPSEIMLRHVPDCTIDNINKAVVSGIGCTTVTTGNFASLNVSLIFGFLNTFVWGANLWFLFKETKWFRATQPDSAIPTPAGMTPTGGMTPQEPPFNQGPPPQMQQYPPQQPQYPPQGRI